MNLERPERQKDIKPELSEAEKEIVKRIEALPYQQDGDKVNLLLVWRGLKPAAEIECEKQRSLDEINKLKKVIQEAGLRMIELKEHIKNGHYTPGFDIVRLFVAKEKNLAEELSQTAGYGEGSKTYGRLSGYPKTAIEAYIEAEEKDEALDATELLIHDSELPEDVRREDFMAFAKFRLSRKNWREEIETARRWAEEIQPIAPALYKRIVTSYKDQNSEH